MKPQDYLTCPHHSFGVHFGDRQPDEDGNPMDEVDLRTVKVRQFSTLEEAIKCVQEEIQWRKNNNDLRWLAFIYIQEDTATLIKDYTEWFAIY